MEACKALSFLEVVGPIVARRKQVKMLKNYSSRKGGRGERPFGARKRVLDARDTFPNLHRCSGPGPLASPPHCLVVPTLYPQTTQPGRHRMLSPAESTLHPPFTFLFLISRVSTLLAALPTPIILHSLVFCQPRSLFTPSLLCGQVATDIFDIPSPLPAAPKFP